MLLQDILVKKREEILNITEHYGAYNVRIFGSVARGENEPDSDIDFLVDLEPDRTLFDMGGMLMDLQDLLQRKVDIVTEKGLHWYIKDRVLREARPL